MKKNILLTILVSAGMTIGLGACGTKDDNPAGDGIAGDDDDDDDDDDDGGSGSGGPATTGDDDDDDNGDSSGGAATGGIGFIEMPDGGGAAFECDIFAQDCPEGEKCMPWANDGGSAWNATRCSPIEDAPAQPGDECTVDGSGVSGLDNCDIGGMCWDVDPETNMGNCVAMCTGDAANPICEDPDTTCVQANGGSLNLCLPVCDPLTPACPDGQNCYPVAEEFTCAPNAAPDALPYDPCEFLNVCPEGHFCANPEFQEDCPQGAAGCCAPFCDLDEADMCPGNTECTAWFDPDNTPPQWDSVGACSLPET